MKSQGVLAGTSIGAVGTSYAAGAAGVIPAPVDEITSYAAAIVALVAGLLAIARSPEAKKVGAALAYLFRRRKQ